MKRQPLTHGKTNFYGMILGRDLLIPLRLDIKFSEHVIIRSSGPCEGCLELMVVVSNYDFKTLMDKTIKPEEYFINFYVDNVFESENRGN